MLCKSLLFKNLIMLRIIPFFRYPHVGNNPLIFQNHYVYVHYSPTSSTIEIDNIQIIPPFCSPTKNFVADSSLLSSKHKHGRREEPGTRFVMILMSL